MPVQPRRPVQPTAGSAPTASTSVTVLGLLHVIKSMVPVAQVVTRTGLDLPVNMRSNWIEENGPENSPLKKAE
ncbi:hypothetical protein RRG08_039265 [Elysia crispata]|uniref:Uncharacterized protein n=1 Tax=Elysia crispata TaxID=231223 RepID=A0AAE1ACR3_9GAST|nr:hypothetical protein RRG08_062547 [Elysia crispata]KAK3800198.1 hypothetical protein RRG08_039265 [Elysia crispata]